MMNIDWSRAPKGYDFYIIDQNGHHESRFHRLEGEKFIDHLGECWPRKSKNMIVLERPEKPAAPEWDGKGQFPPLGTRFRVALGRGEDDLTELVVIAVGRHRLLAVDPNDDEREWVLGKGGEFHTVRTKEQRERDELIKIIGGRSILSHSFEIADDIIAAGYRKEKQDD